MKNILLFLMLYLLSANTAFAQRDHLCLYSKDNTADKSWSLDVVRKIIFTQTDVAVYLWADDASYNVPYGNFRKFTFEGNKTVAVKGITLNKTTATLTEGETLALSATVSPDNATDKTVTWTSSDASVASVSGGTVTALKAGKATIIASCGGKAATCEVTVKAKVIAVTGITINKTTATLTEGETLALSATVSPDNATDKTVTWTSSDASVASVSGGTVTALKAGKATITVTSTSNPSVNATCEITVKAKVTSVTAITLDKTTAEILEGETVTLTATVNPSDATDQTIVWTSSDESVAKVISGVVIGVKAGKATIIASCGGKVATCEVTVKPKTVSVTAVTLDKTTAEILEGETVTLAATVNPSDATDQTIVWTSSDESVAKVISGVVIGVKAGKATIIASCGGKAATCEVTVKPKTISVTSITLDKSRAEMTEGEILTLTADVAPEDATDKTLIWTSSDEAVATVKDGVVTAVKLGRATITAASTSNLSVSATCEVVVFSATGIGSVESDKNEKHDIYNLNGQRVTTMRKGGIYIVNGRKVLAK